MKVQVHFSIFKQRKLKHGSSSWGNPKYADCWRIGCNIKRNISCKIPVACIPLQIIFNIFWNNKNNRLKRRFFLVHCIIILKVSYSSNFLSILYQLWWFNIDSKIIERFHFKFYIFKLKVSFTYCIIFAYSWYILYFLD